jgi:hypothetical protein
MKKVFAFLAALVALSLPSSLMAGSSTIPLFENFGILTNAPQVDAKAFANYGGYFVDGSLLYDFLNTQAYTNRGAMQAGPGFRFDYSDDFGNRRPADVWINQASGVIGASDATYGGVYGGGGYSLYFGAGNYGEIRVNANKIVNRGLLEVPTAGLIKLVGNNVDLSRSGLNVTPITTGIGFQDDDEYIPDAGIYDLAWGCGEQAPATYSPNLVNSYRGIITAQTPSYCLTNENSFPNPDPFKCVRGGFFLQNPASFVYTNAVTETNWIIEVALVSVTDTNLATSMDLYRSTDPTNYFSTFVVKMAASLTNVATAGNDLLTLHLADRVASDTNFNTLTNLSTGNTPFRPAPFSITRDYPFVNGQPRNTNWTTRSNISELVYNSGRTVGTNITTNIFFVGVGPGGVITQSVVTVTNIIINHGYASTGVTNLFSGWEGFVTNVVVPVPDVPGASWTNASGRIEIVSDNLNMENMRVRGEGHVSVNAKHLLSSTNAGIDSPNIFYNLGSTNGSLKLQSLTRPEVERFAGYVQAWSGVWTNQLVHEINSITNTAQRVIVSGTTNDTVTDWGTNNVYTNVIDVGIHLLMVDASQVQTRYPTYINGLETHSKEVILGDTLRMQEKLLVDAERLVINTNVLFQIGDGTVRTLIRDWKAEHFPNLTDLENYGLIVAPNVAYFGSDLGRTNGYERFYNRGTNVATSHFIKAAYFENAGMFTTRYIDAGAISLDADVAKLQDGIFDAGGDIFISGNDVKIRNYTNVATSTLVLSVTNALEDSGVGANSLIWVGRGISLKTVPRTGSLLGTTIEINGNRFEEATCNWAAPDVGPLASAYRTNTGVGRLVLSPGQAGLIRLAGPEGVTGGKYAMYVDSLEFSTSAQGDLAGSVAIDPNLTLYVGSANVPLDTLKAAYGERIAWVPGFTGPASQQQVVLPNGRTVLANRWLLESPSLDSDADGTPNAFDIDPFGKPTLIGVTVGAGSEATITWESGDYSVYSLFKLEATTNVADPKSWTEVFRYAYTPQPSVTIQAKDPLPANGVQRYYRVNASQ